MLEAPDYMDFLKAKEVVAPRAGLAEVPALNPRLFPHQRDTAEFLLRRGTGAAFLDTGLGKTGVELEWARAVRDETRKPVVIHTPLAVAGQMVREAEKFNIDAHQIRDRAEVSLERINICNYERLDQLDPAVFGGVALDESSILKSFNGKTKQRLCEVYRDTPFRQAATATPAPNDYMELGNHSEFLGVMPQNEMLTRWFINDTLSASHDWRLKKHAVAAFWQWVGSWAMCASKPSDLGYDDAGYDLTPYRILRHGIRADVLQDTDGQLFRTPKMSATSLHREKRLVAADRARKVAEIANGTDEAVLIWVDTDYEADAIRPLIRDAIEVRGSEPLETKERKLAAFSDGQVRVLITKPSIAGFGLNWQHCRQMIFAGLSFSYELYYQAIRRCWRFGQLREVLVHVVLADTEAPIWQTIVRKMADHDAMKAAMFRAANDNRAVDRLAKVPFQPTMQAQLPDWLRRAS